MAFQHTDETDAVIKEYYRTARKGRANGSRTTLQDVARQLGCKRHVVESRGRTLELARPLQRGRPWDDPREIRILEAGAHLTARTIQQRLKRAGYTRSQGAIIEYRQKHYGLWADIREDREFYTSGELAALLGVAAASLGRWVRAGELPAQVAERNAPESARVKGDYLFRERDVREFVVNHPLRFDFGRVDRLWFVGLLTGRHGAKG